MGVAHVPEDRHKYGLVLEMTLAENITYKRITKNHTVQQVF